MVGTYVGMYLDTCDSHLCLKKQKDRANEERGTDVSKKGEQGEGDDDLSRSEVMPCAHVCQECDGHEERKCNSKVEGSNHVTNKASNLDEPNLASEQEIMLHG